MRKELKHFLEIQTGYRESLERILMLNVDEPAFRSEISLLLAAVSKLLIYLRAEFDPRFIELSGLLERKLQRQNFIPVQTY